MKNLKKKAFTLVELLVVIAIIAILAVAGVVGYVVFTKKAQQSNDTSLVSQLNEYMAAASSTDDINTVTDARNLLIQDGWELATLKLTAKNYRVAFDIANKKFVKVNKDTPEDYSGKAEDLFVFVGNEADATSFTNAGYSVYLQNGFNAATVSVKSGVDVGENAGISQITYTSEDAGKNVVICTNSYTTNVTVNTKGSVQHYGNVGKLTIQEVALSSFHEFGKVRTAEILKGNFVVEEKAVVTLVSVKAETAGQVKINIDTKGSVEVVAGDTTKYEVTSTKKAEETVNAPVDDNTLAIVNGEVKTTLADEDFGDGKKVVLLKDYETAVNLGSCEIVGNLVKFRANITGSKTITLKNIHSTGLFVSNFTGSLTLDGGLLEYDSSLLANAEAAAIYINTGYGTYTFKNMTIATNTNKGIKISKAASVTVDNCVFDAANLSATGDNYTHTRSLSAIDIQEQNPSAKLTVVIKDCSFENIPQGSLKYGADTDTSAAIKLKSEGQGFQAVTITGNRFVNCYRDVAIGVNIRKTGAGTFLTGKTPALMRANAIDSKFNISNNTTTQTAEGVATIGYFTYEDYSVNPQTGESERVGRIVGGCAVFETARSAHANDDQAN